MKALKWTLAILVLAAAAVTAFYLYSKSKAEAAALGTDPTPTNTGSNPTGIKTDDDSMPLTKGSTGELVTDLQRGINANFGGNISVDGIFGPQTENALRGRGLPITIYWREWSYITRKPIYVNGVLLTISKL